MKNTTPKILALAWVLSTPLAVFAQEADPFADNSHAVRDSVPKMIQLTYEVFSLSMAEVAALHRKGLSDEQLFTEVSKKGNQETFMMVRTRSGQKAMNESIIEQIYPTEYEPPELPNYVGGSLSKDQVDKLKQGAVGSGVRDPGTDWIQKGAELGIIPVTPVTPTSFETRNEGIIFETEASMGADNSIIDMRIAANHVKLVERAAWSQGVATCELPIFANSGINTGITLRAGKPSLLGTVTPKKELLPEKGEARVWLAFVTGSIISL